MRLFPASGSVWTPWKNGGGLTRQIAVYPEAAGLEDFGWRISTARIEGASRFSYFAGIDRSLAVIEGHLRLQIEGEQPALLTVNGPSCSFAGEARVEAEPFSRSVLDFNVMTRRGQYSHQVSPLQLAAQGSATLKPPSEGGRCCTIVYVTDGSCRVDNLADPLELHGADALLIDDQDAAVTLHANKTCALVVAIITRVL